MIKQKTPITLTIAGSDSSGGAGIQADIKAISATGGYACSVITALTAQNTLGVNGIYGIPSSFIREQLDALFTDLDIQAVKIGMLVDSKTIECIAEAIAHYRPKYLVLDPVMVAISGELLLQKEAIESLKSLIIPLATITTPNLPEALALLDLPENPLPQDENTLINLAQGLNKLGSNASLIKGGHQVGEYSTDIFVQGNHIRRFSEKRTITQNTHGTGCTLSSAIASYLAQDNTLDEAVEIAKRYITSAIAYADQLYVGKGSGPVNHFFALENS